MKKQKQALTSEFGRIFALTVCVMVLNYIAYYADDLVYAYQAVPHDTWFTFVCQFLAFPVTVYVEFFEKKYFLHIFLVGRTLNYLIELTYFFTLTAIGYLLSAYCCGRAIIITLRP